MELIHGGDWAGFQTEYAALPLDFSANISPLGLPQGVRRAVLESLDQADRYPDPLCRALRGRLAQATGVPAEHILCGNGAAELIDRLALALGPGRALVTAPTFSEYGAALKRAGFIVQEFPLSEKNDFELTEDILNHITPEVDVVFLCEPNNPTGRTTPRVLLDSILRRCGACGALLAVDECFADFLDRPEQHTLLEELPRHRLLLLRAFTKFYAMAGLRLGYCLCSDRELLERMRLAGQPWPVSVPAQAAGLAALDETAYSERLRRLIREQRPLLLRGLEGCGCRVIPGEANYLLFHHPDGALDLKLRKKGILIRSCSNYSGLGPGWYRTAVRTAGDNERLIRAIAAVLEEQSESGIPIRQVE